MSYDMEDVELLFEVKMSKYLDEELNDDLKDVLFKEALKETIAASYLNGGRKIRT